MKKILCVLLSLIFLLSLCACRKMPTDDFDKFIEPDYSKTEL